MSLLDIFKQDAFSVMRLTQAFRELKYVPSRIGQLGLFQVENIDTLDVAIEKADAQGVILVPASPRGGPGATQDNAKRSMRKLTVPHFQMNDAVYADEVQQVRAFGEESAVETLIGKIAMKVAKHSQNFALTEEYHRLNVIKNGTFLDSDGSVIFNYYTEMGETQPAEIDWDLDNAAPVDGALRKKCAMVARSIAESLDGLPFTGIRALCGDAFFDDLLAHPEVRETYKGWQEAVTLRSAYVAGGTSTGSGIYASFEFGGIIWENYRGGSNVSVATDKCHLVPEGVPGLFRTLYAPADYIETVNRPGQRIYAKQYPMPNDKGVNLEVQMNALHYCTRPRLLQRGKRT